jgi:hypothetical protein
MDVWSGMMECVNSNGGGVMTTNSAERWPDWRSGEQVSVEELARQQGVGPIASVDELARPGTFESDDELDEFLADLYESRRADVS